jgi:U2-associated protein SR140
MSESQDIHEFPTLNTKLAAPSKKSLFERQKAEAEAKRQKERAETAAVYEDFVKSFDDVDERQSLQGSGGKSGLGNFMAAATGLGGPPRRHFITPPAGRAAGRGGNTNGPRGGFPSSGPGSLGPVTGFTKKRTHEGGPPMRAENDYGRLANDNNDKENLMAVFKDSDDEEEEGGSKSERAVPKPIVHLSSLPPGISPKAIKALIPSNLTVDAINLLPPSGPGSAGAERKSSSAIVTLAKDTPANDIDAAVNSLQNRYLGLGYYLNLSRHLSSAALNAGIPVTAGISSALTAMPFGAKPRPSGPSGPMNRAPPPQAIHRGGFAPPASYHGPNTGQYGGSAPLQVTVIPPSDLKQLKLIHKTLEAILTHGPEFETLLMSRTNVQQDEKWAWIWDSRSEGGVWYRWRLWEILSGLEAKSGTADRTHKSHSKQIFDNGLIWEPSKPLRFQYTTQLGELVSASDYDSSEDDESGDEGRTRHHHNRDGPSLTDLNAVGEEKSYLNPLRKTKLTHLLARLPDSIGRLRKGDVARVTAFAIQHSGQGADEVVDMVVSNIGKPYSFTTANIERVQERGSNDDADEDEKLPPKDPEDQSASVLVALYIVSDILSSSSTSGVRHAWRYRQLFESSLKIRNIFERLGRLDKTLRWGRLRAEKWKRSIGSILSLWEGWCVFPQSSHEHFVEMFMNPPPTAAEIAAAEAQKDLVPASTVKSKWKAVDEASSKPSGEISPLIEEEEQVGLDGDPMDEDEDLNDLDGEPMEDVDGESMDSDEDQSSKEEVDSNTLDNDRHEDVAAAPRGVDQTDPDDGRKREVRVNPFAISRMKRPKAEDMFADSDGD